jgi:hypothetical protein
MTDLISVQLTGHVAVVEMHRPPNNFFDEALLASLAETLAALDEDGAVRCVVLCSEGKHFCAGAQLDGISADGIRRVYRQAFGLFMVRKPVVAAVQGSAVGGGLGLALAADFRVAVAQSRFVANFARLGFHQGFGLSVTLPAVVGRQRALEEPRRSRSASATGWPRGTRVRRRSSWPPRSPSRPRCLWSRSGRPCAGRWWPTSVRRSIPRRRPRPPCWGPRTSARGWRPREPAGLRYSAEREGLS